MIQSLVGTTVGSVTIERLLGYLNTDILWWEGRDIQTQALRWVLGLAPHLADDESIQAQWLERGRALQTFLHRYVLSLVEIVELGKQGNFFIYEAMPDARSLFDWRGQLTSSQISTLFSGLAEVVEAAHTTSFDEKSIALRCELKPNCIFVAVDQDTVLFRWLCVPAVSVHHQNRTQAGVLRGKDHFLYTSPENIKGEVKSQASDFFSLGSMLLETVTGEHTFQGGSDLELLNKIGEGDSTSLKHADVSPGLRSLVQDLLQPNQEDRLSDPDVFKARLHSSLKTSSSGYDVVSKEAGYGKGEKQKKAGRAVPKEKKASKREARGGGITASKPKPQPESDSDSVATKEVLAPRKPPREEAAPAPSRPAPAKRRSLIASKRQRSSAPSPSAKTPSSPAPKPQQAVARKAQRPSAPSPTFDADAPAPAPKVDAPTPVLTPGAPAPAPGAPAPAPSAPAPTPSPASGAPAPAAEVGALPQQKEQASTQAAEEAVPLSIPAPELSSDLWEEELGDFDGLEAGEALFGELEGAVEEQRASVIDSLVVESEVSFLEESFDDDVVMFGEAKLEDIAKPEERVAKVLRRKGVVRNYTQMNPGKIFPLLVSIVEAELYIKIPDLPQVQQVESEQVLEIKESSPYVRIVPVLPGCLVSPPEAVVDVRKEKVDVEFWVAPQAEGDLTRSARIQIWHDGTLKDEIPIPCQVVTQTLTKIASYTSVFSSFGGAVLETYGPQLKTSTNTFQSEAPSLVSFALQKVVSLLSSSGIWLGLFFLTIAFFCYLWLRPKRGDIIERFLSTEIH